MYKRHIKISFASDFSRNAREGNVRLDKLIESQDNRLNTNLANLDTGEESCINHANTAIFQTSPVNYNPFHPNIVKFFNKWGYDYLRYGK